MIITCFKYNLWPFRYFLIFTVAALPCVAELEIQDYDGQKTDTSKSIATDKNNAVTNEPLKLMIELSDGSMIFGMPSIAALPFKTSFSEDEVKLQFNLLDSIDYPSDEKPAAVRFINGDKLEGKTSIQKLEMKTILGKVSIPLKNVVAMKIIAGGNQNASLLKGCVLYYSFDKDEGEKVTDKSGKGNDGVINGGVTWTAKGRVGGAYEFNGIDSSIEAPDSDSLDIEGPHTIALWFKTDDTKEGWSAILTKGEGGNRNYDIQRYQSQIDYHVMVAGVTRLRVESETKVTDGKWHHVATTWDSKKFNLYLDGKLEGTGNYIDAPIKNNCPLFVGWLPNYQEGHLKGSVDEIRIYKRVLDAFEISRLAKP